LGPHFGEWLARKISLSSLLVFLWPFVRWTTAIAFTVLAVEILYYCGPYVKQRFRSTIPGAILSVTFWIGWSHLLGIYLRHFTDYNRTYGMLGGFIALMIWLYGSSFVVLVGAELNAELARESSAIGTIGRSNFKRRSSDQAA